MKKNYYLIFIMAFAILLSSCGGGGGNTETVKLIPVKNGKEFQYIDKDGKIIINPQFANASIFREGIAVVQTSGDEPKWGFIGEDGKYIITANYKQVTIFNEGMAWVTSENTAPAAIDTKGQIKFTMQNAEVVHIFKEGLAAFSQIGEDGKEKWGFVDKTGAVKINPQFANTGDFNDGKCAVCNDDGKWGFIDKDGKILINFQFDGAGRFINGKSVVVSGGKSGLIGSDGKYLINPQFTDMINDGDLFLINQGGKWGWADKEGKMTINPQFSNAFPFNGGELAAVNAGKSWGYVDKEGKIVINPQFDYACPFNGKLALVESASKFGFIDNEGKYVINPQFDDVSSDLAVYFSSGRSNYNQISTDFFNVSAIVERIKRDLTDKTVAGVTYTTSMSEILTKFKVTENEFSNTYANEHRIITAEKITSDATLDFYIIGSPFREVRDGYYSTRRVFDNNANPDGFAYSISLSGKGYDKQAIVISALEQIFTGYTKVAEESNESQLVYKNAFQSIKVLIKNPIIIIISKNR